MNLVERLRDTYENWGLGSKGPGILTEAADAIERLQKELETAREALEGSMSLINRLMHVHVAPDECTSYVEPSRKWFCDNGGTLACIADQQAINRRALKDKEVAG